MHFSFIIKGIGKNGNLFSLFFEKLPLVSALMGSGGIGLTFDRQSYTMEGRNDPIRGKFARSRHFLDHEGKEAVSVAERKDFQGGGTVSIVVPVYNTAAYLDRCLQSLVQQSYADLQILLIDDGSTDESASLCDRWAEKDRRIQVIHKENEGLGMARNTGIEAAGGDALCFVDSDDVLHPDAVALAYGTMQQHSVQVVLFGMDWEKEGKREITLTKRIFRGREVQWELLPQLLQQEGNLPISSCAGLYSMDLIRKLSWRFPSEREIIAEDVYALLQLYAGAESAAVVPDALYGYCARPESLTRRYRPDRFEKLKVFYEACLRRCRALELPGLVSRSCAAPFLGLLVGCMKQEAREKNWDSIRNMLADPLVKRALKENPERPNRKKRLLLLAMKHSPAGVWLLLWLHRKLCRGGNLG